MVAVRHWHAGGVCISAHSRRGKDSAGAAAQPGNVDQVSPAPSETPSIGMVTLHTPVLLLFVKTTELLTDDAVDMACGEHCVKNENAVEKEGVYSKCKASVKLRHSWL